MLRVSAISTVVHRTIVTKSQHAVQRPSPPPPPPPLPSSGTDTRSDPYTILAPQLTHLRHAIIDLLGTSHPTLTEISHYYFLHPSKQLRPLLVFLFARATNDLPRTRPLTIPTPSSNPILDSPPLILPTQTRLAQIVEMIHLASLLHDDITDPSPLRRSALSALHPFGNKLSVLGGDFLLGRASASLSRLGVNEVVELIATVISNIVEGAILQMQHFPGPLGVNTVKDCWDLYMRKTYLKTASLMAKGARAAVVLGGSVEGDLWKEIAYAYGRDLGFAFQLVDDLLDYESGEAALDKPGGADLQLDLTTGPALFAWEQYPEMGLLMKRKFAQQGDVELARDYVRRSSAVERTRDLARAHANKAKEVASFLPDSDAKIALQVLTERVVERT